MKCFSILSRRNFTHQMLQRRVENKLDSFKIKETRLGTGYLARRDAKESTFIYLLIADEKYFSDVLREFILRVF